MTAQDHLHLLHKTITTATTILVLLQLNLSQFSEWLKDGSKLLFVDAEVDVANIQPVERHTIGIAVASVLVLARLAILLGLGELNNDRNAAKFLASQRNSSFDRFLILEFNITNTSQTLLASSVMSMKSKLTLLSAD